MAPLWLQGATWEYIMDVHQKPLSWEDAAAQHDPASLPFWRFYLEARDQMRHPSMRERVLGWLAGRQDPSIPPP